MVFSFLIALHTDCFSQKATVSMKRLPDHTDTKDPDKGPAIPKADLVLVSANADLNSRTGTYPVTIVVKNNGNKTAAACTLLFDGRRLPFSSLAAGKSRTITDLTCICNDRKGDYYQPVIIDVDNIIQESNEGNNKLFLAVPH
jgi:subtilase family serine protease